MTSRQMTEWIAYAGFEPFGSLRQDLHAGIVASTIANVNRNPKKKAAPYKPADFIAQGSAAKHRDAPDPKLLSEQIKSGILGSAQIKVVDKRKRKTKDSGRG